ncbi:hypothetical protein F4677DRAFT_449388 [Hypoxylon crocopeplum]|nr:hypothetical protein F4677DRAFT_449388 [Hypoxylon crocopeplum]
MTLLTLPSELLFHVMEHLRDSRDVHTLQSVACTCKALREIAEIYLYSTAVFIKLSSLYEFFDAIRTEPKRKGYLRDLQLLFSTQLYNPGTLSASPPDLASFPNLTSLVSESPECQPSSLKGTHWNEFMDYYLQTFEQASLLNESVGAQKPLLHLRSLTLHWSGIGSRFWDITPACSIFLLPQLRSLEISCAAIGQRGYTEWEPEKLQRFQRQTQLKSLTFTECTVSIAALHAILSFPIALQRLVLCEKFYHRSNIDWQFALNDSDAFNCAIAQQARSLEHLHIFRRDEARELTLSLSNFPVLSHLQLGPFLSILNYGLELPAPPVLQSLRLDEYSISMLQSQRADRILSDLSFDELLRNAEARNASFTLDISLPRRNHYNNQDLRLSVRKPVEKLGNQFRRRQDASILTHPESRALSRLRILTNEYRGKIPPFLCGESLPRFFVRYDSQHPNPFLSDPYTANILPPGRDISSDNEGMDVIFSHVA